MNEIIQDKKAKVVIMGMENAGKTTLIDVIAKRVKIPFLKPPKMIPTNDIARTLLNQNKTVIWDFGGQELFRNIYLAKPETYLKSISLVYYVVDIQDFHRFKSSVLYFTAVFQKILIFSPNAEIIFIFHKMDPNYDPKERNLKREFLDSVESFLKMNNKSYNTYNTTIFDIEGVKTAFKDVV